MEYNKEYIYRNTSETIHWLYPIVKKYCDQYNVDIYLIMSIFEFENRKHKDLIPVYKNPGNIKTEESQFILPVKYDNIEVSIEYYIRMMYRIIEKNKIITVNDIKKLLRPLEPEWADEVSEVYQNILNMHRGV